MLNKFFRWTNFFWKKKVEQIFSLLIFHESLEVPGSNPTLGKTFSYFIMTSHLTHNPSFPPSSAATRSYDRRCMWDPDNLCTTIALVSALFHYCRRKVIGENKRNIVEYIESSKLIRVKTRRDHWEENNGLITNLVGIFYNTIMMKTANKNSSPQ